MGNRSLGRNDAPVLTIAAYFFYPRAKKFDIFIIFLYKEKVRLFKGREPACGLACGLFLNFYR